VAARATARMMRPGVAGQPVVEPPGSGQRQHVRRQGHQQERPAPAVRARAQRAKQRAGPARRVQAARQRHQRDRAAHAKACGEPWLGDPVAGRETHGGGDHVASDYRPGLRQRAGRHRETSTAAAPSGATSQGRPATPVPNRLGRTGLARTRPPARRTVR
jgi:hypothetical protein